MSSMVCEQEPEEKGISSQKNEKVLTEFPSVEAQERVTTTKVSFVEKIRANVSNGLYLLATFMINLLLVYIVFLFKVRNTVASTIVLFGRVLFIGLEIAVILTVLAIEVLCCFCGYENVTVQTQATSVKLTLCNARELFWKGKHLHYDNSKERTLNVEQKDFKRIISDIEGYLIPKEGTFLSSKSIRSVKEKVGQSGYSHNQNTQTGGEQTESQEQTEQNQTERSQPGSSLFNQIDMNSTLETKSISSDDYSDRFSKYKQKFKDGTKKFQRGYETNQ